MWFQIGNYSIEQSTHVDFSFFAEDKKIHNPLEKKI